MALLNHGQPSPTSTAIHPVKHTSGKKTAARLTAEDRLKALVRAVHQVQAELDHDESVTVGDLIDRAVARCPSKPAI